VAKLLTVRNARRPRADTALKPTHEYMVMLRQHIAATYLSRKKKSKGPRASTLFDEEYVSVRVFRVRES